MIKPNASLPKNIPSSRLRKVVVSIVLLCVLFAIAVYDPRTVGYWRSLEGQEAYEAAYTEALATLPPPTQTWDINTTYGTVRVYGWTNAQNHSKTPAVLLAGRASGVPMWRDNLSALAATRPVYALDALGDAGLSTQTAPLKNGADQAAWVDQVLQALQLESVHLVGHSFGGWAAANYASRYPQRVASLTLLEPVSVFQGIKWGLIVKSIPVSIPFLPRSWRGAFLQDVGGSSEIDLNDPMARMIALGTEYYAAKLPAPEQISNEQMQSWSMPVFVAMASNSVFHDGAKAVVVATENVKRVQAKRWPNTTHSLPMEVAPELNSEIIRFTDANEPR